MFKKLLKIQHIWAIFDQGLYSISNFFLNIILARLLLESEYGAFAYSYSIFLFVMLVHTALIAEPMMVFGGRRYKHRVMSYFNTLLRYHFLFSIIFATLLFSVGYILFNIQQTSLGEAFFGIAVSLGFILLFYKYRKFCYVVSEVKIAALGGFIYLITIVGGVFLLYSKESLSIFSSFLLMALGAALASVVMHFFLRIPLQKKLGKLHYFSVAKNHFHYGKWALGTGILIWFPANIYYFVLPYSGGLETNALFKALMNFVMPIVQTNIALSNVLLPGLARIKDKERFFEYLKKFIFLISIACIAYWIFLGLSSKFLVELLYNGKYATSPSTYWLLGAVPLVSWLALSTRSALKAIERPDLVFWSNVVSTLLCLTIGVVFAYYYGVVGAIAAMLISYFAMFLMLLLNIKTVSKNWS